jgi:hypothetical protein
MGASGLTSLGGRVLLVALAACSLHCSSTPRASSVQPARDEPGRDLYANKCQGCHRLRRPEDYSQTQWPALMDRMAIKAKLTPREKELIESYVLSACEK